MSSYTSSRSLDAWLRQTQEKIAHEMQWSVILRTFVSQFVAAIIIGAAQCLIITAIPDIYASYNNVSGIRDPSTMLLVGLSLFAVYVCWAVFTEQADVPSANGHIIDSLYVFYRAPMSREGWYNRLAALFIRVAWAVAVVTGTALGILFASQRNPTALSANTGVDNVGQPVFENALLTHGNTIVLIAMFEIVRSVIRINVVLGNDRTYHYWPSWDHSNFKQVAPYSAALEAAFAFVTLPVLGGLVSWQYVLGSAIAAQQTGDTGLFVLCLFIGDIIGVVFSWFLYVFPSLARLHLARLPSGKTVDPPID